MQTNNNRSDVYPEHHLSGAVMDPDHWCWPNCLNIFALCHAESEKNLLALIHQTGTLSPHVLTSLNPSETQDLIRGTPSPAPPRTSIVCPLWQAPSLASARTHNRVLQKPLPVTLQESLGQRSLVASGLHDNSLVVPRTFHPTTHTHINARKQLLSTRSCASKETPEVEFQPKHLQPLQPFLLVLYRSSRALWLHSDRKQKAEKSLTHVKSPCKN